MVDLIRRIAAEVFIESNDVFIISAIVTGGGCSSKAFGITGCVWYVDIGFTAATVSPTVTKYYAIL